MARVGCGRGLRALVALSMRTGLDPELSESLARVQLEEMDGVWKETQNSLMPVLVKAWGCSQQWGPSSKKKRFCS